MHEQKKSLRPEGLSCRRRRKAALRGQERSTALKTRHHTSEERTAFRLRQSFGGQAEGGPYKKRRRRKAAPLRKQEKGARLPPTPELRRTGRRRPLQGEEHVGGGKVLALAVVEVEDQIVFEDVVVGGIAECAGCLVDSLGRALEFDEGADGGLVEVDEEAFGPGEARRETIGGTVFFVTEPTLEAEPLEDSLERGGVDEDDFDLFANFVAAVGVRSDGADGELFGRGFEGEDDTRWGFARARRTAVRSRRSRDRGFGADAEKLTMPGEATIGSVEDDVVLVDAWGDGSGAELFESAEEGFGVGEAEFDFGLAGHGARRISDIGYQEAGGEGVGEGCKSVGVEEW